MKFLQPEKSPFAKGQFKLTKTITINDTINHLDCISYNVPSLESSEYQDYAILFQSLNGWWVLEQPYHLVELHVCHKIEVNSYLSFNTNKS